MLGWYPGDFEYNPDVSPKYIVSCPQQTASFCVPLSHHAATTPQPMGVSVILRRSGANSEPIGEVSHRSYDLGTGRRIRRFQHHNSHIEKVARHSIRTNHRWQESLEATLASESPLQEGVQRLCIWACMLARKVRIQIASTLKRGC